MVERETIQKCLLNACLQKKMRSCLQGSRFRQVVHPIKERKREKTVRHIVGAVGQSHRVGKEANVVEPIAKSRRPSV